MACKCHDVTSPNLLLTSSCSCENNILWRGHFNATGEETAANLSINGGTGLCSPHTTIPQGSRN